MWVKFVTLWITTKRFGKKFWRFQHLRIGDYEIASRAYIGRFNFKGQDQQKRVGELSGGERNRLQLAKSCKWGANVILLDEPSNDLDIETLRVLDRMYF